MGSRGSLRPPKRRPKAKNGQKITVFALERGLPGKKTQVGLYPHYTVYIYKKKFLTKTSCLKLISNNSMDVSGTYYNPYQGFLTHSGASGRLRSHILALF